MYGVSSSLMGLMGEYLVKSGIEVMLEVFTEWIDLMQVIGDRLDSIVWFSCGSLLEELSLILLDQALYIYITLNMTN